MEPEKENTNARRTGTITTGPQSGITPSDTKPAVTSSLPASAPRTSRPRTNNRNVPTTQRRSKGRQAVKQPVQATRQDWRTSIYATFAGWATVVAGATALLTRSWQAPVSFGIGLLFCAVMWKGASNVKS